MKGKKERAPGPSSAEQKKRNRISPHYQGGQTPEKMRERRKVSLRFNRGEVSFLV